MLKRIDTPLGHWIILLSLSLIWGSSFILMKRGLDAFSFEQVATLRLSIAFISVALLGRKFYREIPTQSLWALFGTGFVGSAIPAILFSKAETYLESGLVGMLNVLTPLFTLFIGVVFYALKVKRANYLGAFIGVIGTVFLLFPEIQELNTKTLQYSMMVIVATACYGWSANIIKAHLQHLNALQITTLSLTFVGPWAIIHLFSGDFIEVMQSHPKAWASFGYTAILAITSSVLSVIAFNKLIKMTGAVFATSCTYIISIIAILWGVIDQEIITIHQITGFTIIIAGVYLVNKRS